MSNGTAPSDDTVSTRISASGAASRIAAASSGIGFMTPGRRLVVGQQDGLVVAAAGASRSRTSSGAAAQPHSAATRSTFAPYASAIFANRSPNAPIETPSTRSPGDSVLTTAASRPPVPAQDRIAMSPVVPKYGFMPAWSRPRSSLNSGPRWLIICRPPASRTLGGEHGRAGDAQVRLGAGRQGLRRSVEERATARWSHATRPAVIPGRESGRSGAAAAVYDARQAFGPTPGGREGGGCKLPLPPAVPKEAPEGLRKFIACEANQVTLANGTLGWLSVSGKDVVPPDVAPYVPDKILNGTVHPGWTITPDPSAPGKAEIKRSESRVPGLGTVGPSIPASVESGTLTAETSGLHEGAEGSDRLGHQEPE